MLVNFLRFASDLCHDEGEIILIFDLKYFFLDIAGKIVEVVFQLFG